MLGVSGLVVLVLLLSDKAFDLLFIAVMQPQTYRSSVSPAGRSMEYVAGASTEKAPEGALPKSERLR